MQNLSRVIIKKGSYISFVVNILFYVHVKCEIRKIHHVKFIFYLESLYYGVK